MRFYVSHLARLDYIKALADKNVNDAFMRYLVEAKEPQYNGMPVRKVGAIKEEIMTSPATGSQGLLINPNNIVWGVHRDISVDMERKPRKRVIEVTMTMKVDAKLEQEDACVKVIDILTNTGV